MMSLGVDGNVKMNVKELSRKICFVITTLKSCKRLLIIKRKQDLRNKTNKKRVFKNRENRDLTCDMIYGQRLVIFSHGSSF